MIQPWFEDAKLGIFIHWGLYAVEGIPESWSFFRGKISHEDYLRQFEGFTAGNYDPRAWAQLARRAGARYAVLTAKHHDGVALWDTEHSGLNVAERSPAARDLVGPFVDAMREENVKVGVYFSHLDWSHPDYASIHHETERRNPDFKPYEYDPLGYSFPRKGQMEDPDAWKRFIDYHRGQLEELTRRYRPDLFWFDGDWERSPEQWNVGQLTRFLHNLNPAVVLNDRMGGIGDYQTVEQALPIERPDPPWELCMTINDSWGHQPEDRNFKSVRQLIRTFAEVIGAGGNLLLNVGPMADGTIPPEQVERLEALGDWIRRHEEAVYGTGAGLPEGYYYGPSTISRSGDCLYLFFFDVPRDSIAVRGLASEVVSATTLGSDHALSFRKDRGAEWQHMPGTLWIDLPKDALDADATVVRIQLKEPLQIYQGTGGADHYGSDSD